MLYGSLSDIERNYGCVAEYNRCMNEMQEHEYELQVKLNNEYKDNKQKLDTADENGSLVYFAWECVNCPHYTPIGMTWNEDDIEHGICNNLQIADCEYRQKYKE